MNFQNMVKTLWTPCIFVPFQFRNAAGLIDNIKIQEAIDVYIYSHGYSIPAKIVFNYSYTVMQIVCTIDCCKYP